MFVIRRRCTAWASTSISQNIPEERRNLGIIWARSISESFFPEFPKFENDWRFVSRYGGVVKFSRSTKNRFVKFHIYIWKNKSGKFGRLPKFNCAKKTYQVPGRNYGKSSPTRMTLTMLAICQCAAWPSTLITQNIPERRNPRNQRKPMSTFYVYFPRCAYLRYSVVVFAPSSISICTRYFLSSILDCMVTLFNVMLLQEDHIILLRCLRVSVQMQINMIRVQLSSAPITTRTLPFDSARLRIHVVPGIKNRYDRPTTAYIRIHTHFWADRVFCGRSAAWVEHPLCVKETLVLAQKTLTNAIKKTKLNRTRLRARTNLGTLTYETEKVLICIPGISWSWYDIHSGNIWWSDGITFFCASHISIVGTQTNMTILLSGNFRSDQCWRPCCT